MSDKPLKPCPFCGSQKLKVEKKSGLGGWNGLDDRVERHTFSVRCNICHARGPAIGGRVIPKFRPDRLGPDMTLKLPPWATTDDALRDTAIKNWNSRVEDDDSCIFGGKNDEQS